MSNSYRPLMGVSISRTLETTSEYPQVAASIYDQLGEIERLNQNLQEIVGRLREKIEPIMKPLVLKSSDGIMPDIVQSPMANDLDKKAQDVRRIIRTLEDMIDSVQF